MKKLLCASVLSLISFLGFAQSQSLEFYYIAHDRTTPVNELCQRLESVYETALSYEDFAVIFYLPNFDAPKVVKINLPGDNRDEFKNIISELRLKSAHEIYADVDYENIMQLINAHDFIDENGAYKYMSVLFCWYVNPDFWQFLHNEKLIAALYFALELNKYPDYVSTQVWHSSDDGLVVDEKNPFGSKNLCKDMMFLLQQY